MGASIPPLRDLNHSDEQHLAVIRAWADRQDVIRGIMMILVFSAVFICIIVFLAAQLLKVG